MATAPCGVCGCDVYCGRIMLAPSACEHATRCVCSAGFRGLHVALVGKCRLDFGRILRGWFRRGCVRGGILRSWWVCLFVVGRGSLACGWGSVWAVVGFGVGPCRVGLMCVPMGGVIVRDVVCEIAVLGGGGGWRVRWWSVGCGWYALSRRCCRLC